MSGRRIGAIALAGFARAFGLLDFAVAELDLADLDLGADLAGIGIPWLDLFWARF